MAIVGLSIGSYRKYQSTLDPDKGTPKATVWLLGSLSVRDRARLLDNLTSYAVSFRKANLSPDEVADEDIVSRIPMNQMMVDTFRIGVKGWENFLDENGKEIPYATEKTKICGKEYDLVKMELVDRVPFDIVRELHNEIMSDNAVAEEEVKNSKKR